MDKLSVTTVLAIVFTALYGLTSLAGGIIGYLKADSKASLIAGGISGVLLLFCALGTPKFRAASLIGALIVALALAGRFAPKALGLAEKSAGPVDYVMTIGGALVIVLSVLALLTLFRSSSGS